MKAYPRSSIVNFIKFSSYDFTKIKEFIKDFKDAYMKYDGENWYVEIHNNPTQTFYLMPNDVVYIIERGGKKELHHMNGKEFHEQYIVIDKPQQAKEVYNSLDDLRG